MTETTVYAETWQRVGDVIREVLNHNHQPSAAELLDEIVMTLEYTSARWLAKPVIESLIQDHSLTSSRRDYLSSLLADDSLVEAMLGTPSHKAEIESSIDQLLRQSTAYKSSEEYREMLEFMGRFRDYAPYNNMLVRLQSPSCTFFATEKDWREKFGRKLIEDAKPMLILAPMHPVMLVFELDQTSGPALPREIGEFARFEGKWNEAALSKTIENAYVRDRIRIGFKRLSSTNAGFAALAHGDAKAKMRIAIHEDLDKESAYGVLCHELAHVYLGHLGSDEDHWWPSRSQLERNTEEIEAESVAYLVTSRAGLWGPSNRYIAGHLKDPALPKSVSLDLVAKVASRIEEMGKRAMAERPLRKKKVEKGRGE
jgi:hypothetical protein